MTRFLGGLQVVAVLAQGAPDLFQAIPPRYHPLFHFALSAAQALGWWAQRNFNPDGTSAVLGYKIPEEK